MSIIKGKNNIVAGFGGTKRCIGEVYFSQSGLASDNPGALPGWTGEYYENGKTLFPDLYNFVKAHSELQVTKAQYDSAIATYGECPKYVVDENGTEEDIEQTVPAYVWLISDGTSTMVATKTRNPQIGDDVWNWTADDTIDFTHETPQYTVKSLVGDTLTCTLNVTERLFTFTFSKEQATGGTITVITNTGTSLRLPKYANYIKCANSTDGITQKKAGLPNIDSDTNWVNATGGTETAATNTNTLSNKGVFGGTNSQGGHGISGNNYSINWRRFDASISNAIYGASDTVTPAHTTLYPWVVAYTAAISASEAQAAEFTGALSGKANTDLSNIDVDIDYVVEYKINSDGSWYRKYKSNWVVQGGISSTIAGGATATITLLKPYANTTYNIMVQPVGAYTAIGEANNTIPTKTTTSFVIACGQAATQAFSWRTEGQGGGQ